MKGALSASFIVGSAMGGTVEERFSQFAVQQRSIVRDYQTHDIATKTISAAYDSFKANSGLTYTSISTSISELTLMFRAADETSFYTSLPEHASDMQSLARMLRERGEVSVAQISKTYFALIAARNYEGARQWRIENNLKVRFEDHELVSVVSDTREMGELKLGKDGVKYQSFAFPAGGFLLAVAHPQCHFSQYAINAIHSDTQLMGELSGRVRWLAPQQREDNLENFRRWNAGFPNAPIFQAYANSTWPSVDTWETPTFYFHWNGILKEKIVGWPIEGRRKEVYRALKMIGITSRAP